MEVGAGGEGTKPVADTHGSPWIRNNGNFKSPLIVSNSDLTLPKSQAFIYDGTLRLDESDYIPIEIGWGFCLLGFFAGKSPGRGAIERMTKAWPHDTHFSCHDNGWIVFRFETKEMMEDIKKGNYEIFGISLILSYLPRDFRFDTTPVFKYRVWATLPNLPLALWNPNALGKIASLIGEPVAVDHKTMARNHIDGPRVQVLVDPAKPPLYAVNLSLHNGTTFEQKIVYDYYPIFCSTCSRVGHASNNCRMNEWNGQSNRPRPNVDRQRDKADWRFIFLQCLEIILWFGVKIVE